MCILCAVKGLQLSFFFLSYNFFWLGHLFYELFI